MHACKHTFRKQFQDTRHVLDFKKWSGFTTLYCPVIIDPVQWSIQLNEKFICLSIHLALQAHAVVDLEHYILYYKLMDF